MDIPYSDPSPAIDYLMRSQRESSNDNGGGDGPNGPWGCVVVVIGLIAIGFLFYIALKPN